MKEIGVSMMMRMTARGIKPRLVIFEENGKWVVRSESSIRNHVCEFVLGVEFDEETADGRKIRVSQVDQSGFFSMFFYRKELIKI